MTLGLDLGRAGVKLVRRTKRGLTCAEQPVDPELSGEAREDALVAALEAARIELGVRPGAEVHVAVPRAWAVVKSLTLPDVGPEELPQLLRFQAAKAIPFDLSELSLTWAELGPDGAGGKRYALAAVKESTLDELRVILTRAALRPGRLEVSSQAAARLVSPEAGEVLLVDVGHSTSDVLLIDEGRLIYSRSASVGLGSEGWQERLPQEVARSLVAARTEAGAAEPEHPPARVLLAGGGAEDPALHSALTQRVGAPVEAIHVEGQDDAARGARLVIAAGLVAPVRAELPYLDLAHRARAHAARSTRRRNVSGSLVGGVLLVAGVIGGHLYLQAQEAAIAELETESEALGPSVQRVKALQEELRSIRGWDAHKGRELEALLAVTAALPGEDEAYLTELRWSHGRGLGLRGRAKSWANVEAFFSRLEQDPLVRAASIEQVSLPKNKNSRGVEFAGQVRLVIPGGQS